jgi:hypothetical protein
LTIVFLCLGIASCATQDKNANSALLGKWKNVDGTLYFNDGTTDKSSAQCLTEFFPTQFVSECVNRNNKGKSVYSYRMIAPEKYEVELVENKNAPALVGTRVKSEFRIENNRLIIISYPQLKDSGSMKTVVKVESVYMRE